MCDLEEIKNIWNKQIFTANKIEKKREGTLQTGNLGRYQVEEPAQSHGLSESHMNCSKPAVFITLHVMLRGAANGSVLIKFQYKDYLLGVTEDPWPGVMEQLLRTMRLSTSLITSSSRLITVVICNLEVAHYSRHRCEEIRLFIQRSHMCQNVAENCGDFQKLCLFFLLSLQINPPTNHHTSSNNVKICESILMDKRDTCTDAAVPKQLLPGAVIVFYFCVLLSAEFYIDSPWCILLFPPFSSLFTYSHHSQSKMLHWTAEFAQLTQNFRSDIRFAVFSFLDFRG